MDAVWIDRVKKGDSDAFRMLYEQLTESATRTAIAITRNHEMAKDAVQETFIRVYRNIGLYDLSKPFEPWFYRILTNECNRLLKKESKTPLRSVDEWQEHSPQPFRSPADVYDAIQSLKDLYRIPIILKYLKDFTEREIAEVLELNVNTVKTRLLKARNLLKQKMKVSEEG